MTIEPLGDEEQLLAEGLREIPSDQGRPVIRRIPAGAAAPGPGVEVPLEPVRLPGDRRAGRWAIIGASYDDVGEVDASFTFDVRRDVDPPPLTVEAPFISPPWPFAARLAGSTDPGAAVSVDGGATTLADAAGVFTAEVTLPPWPQDLRFVATDRAGNMTTVAISVVGGVDYRGVPWAAVLAVVVIAAVVASGTVGTRRRRGPLGPGAEVVPGESPGPELEDLPPGGGL
jgi:hypothetical protein